MISKRIVIAVAVVTAFRVGVAGCTLPTRSAPQTQYRDWKVYGGGWDSIRYSALDQIHRGNVHTLEVAWKFDTGDAFKGSEMPCNPIVVNGVLYATSPKGRVFALDAATGKLRWVFDPNALEGRKRFSKLRNRGLTYWNDGEEGRIYVPLRQWLYALDVATGKPVPTFGTAGRIDLREGLGRDPKTLTVSATAPGVIYRDLLIIGSIVGENLPAAPGDIRAYELRTGKLRWTFHTIPHPGEFGYETWPKDAWQYIGGANSWAGMSVDQERGLVFAPTGSASFDFYGDNRVGDNLFANSVLCLRAATGERVWHFQTVKHDTWDRDLPAPPSLVSVNRDGRVVDAVAQITKSGYVWLFERETGKPLFPFEYRKVPPSEVEGEVLADTQPFPLKPLPFARQRFTEDMVTKRTPEAHKAVLEKLRTLKSGEPFTPISKEGTVVFPGLDGGAEWGGAAFDPETGLLYVNSSEMVWFLRLVKREQHLGQMSARELYRAHCASCHRTDRKGTPPEFPSLIETVEKYTYSEIYDAIWQGAGRMPGFAHLGWQAVWALTEYLRFEREVETTAVATPWPIHQKYTHDGYHRLLDPDGYPAVEPPWGTLNAINLNTGEIAWKIPLGEFPELVKKGIRNTGSENYGGPVVTAGGLLFIGATNHDKKFRAFDKATGRLLWETTLPAAGNATPAVYEVSGRQFVVIAAGGGKWGLPAGASYVAFALSQ